MPENLSALLPLLVAATLTAGLITSLVARVLPRLPFVPRGGRIELGGTPQELRIPRLGGIAIFAGIGAACVFGLVARWSEWQHAVPRDELLALALGAAIVFTVGLVDDLVGATPVQKFLVQILAAWLVVRVGWQFTVLNLPGVGAVDLGVWGGVISIFWIVGVTNAINLIDGLDGLAGGVAAIIASSLVVYASVQGNQGTTILFAAVAGACVGFLPHNWEPAQVYMGDAGSLTLGFLFATMTLHSSLKASAAVAILVPILALGLPVIDTLLVMAFRFAEGEGRGFVRRFARMFRADRRHLHHLLGHAVKGRSRLVLMLYVVVAIFCLGSLAVALSGDFTLGATLLAVEFVAVVAMRRTGLAAQAARLASGQRKAARLVLEDWVEEGRRRDVRERGEPVSPQT